MDPTSILQMLAGMATAPGQTPPGASPYYNPYGWSPMTDRTLGPAMAQSNQTTQMIGMFAPLLMQMFAPKLASQIQSMSNINPGFVNQAKQLQDMQFRFSQAQSAQQTAAIGGLLGASGMPMSKEAIGQISQYLPIANMLMPGLSNALTRFDVGGSGFGYDAAMMSMARAGGLSPGRLNINNAEHMAKSFAAQYQRDGTGGLTGARVLDINATQGLNIAEMAQMTAGLTARGITGDAYGGLTDVNRIRSKLSKEDQTKFAGAESVQGLRELGLGSEKLNDASNKVMDENNAKNKEVGDKYAKAIHQMGSIFTTMQGNSEELLKMVEKLEGPLAKLDPDSLERTMAKFIKLMDVSGLSAEELARTSEVVKARTGLADNHTAMQIGAQTAGARRGLMMAGASDADATRIASETADMAGVEVKRLVGRGMGSFMTAEGLEALKQAEAYAEDPNASAEQRRWADSVLSNPMAAKTQSGAAIIDKNKAGEATAYRQDVMNDRVSQDSQRAHVDATSRALGTDPAKRAEHLNKILAGTLSSRLNSTLSAIRATDSGKAILDASKEQIAKYLGKDVKDVTDNDVERFTAAAVIGKSSGAAGLSAALAAMGIHGKAAAEASESILEGGLSGLTTAVGAVDGNLTKQLEAGFTLGIDTKQIGARTEAQLIEDIHSGKVVNAGNTAQAITAFLENDKGGKAKTFEDFAKAGLQALGILGKDAKFSDAQIKTINDSGWGKEYDEIQKLTDPEKKKERMKILAGDISGTLKIGNRDVENALSGDASNSALVEAFGKSRTTAEKAKDSEEEAKKRAGEALNGKEPEKQQVEVTVAIKQDSLEYLEAAKSLRKSVDKAGKPAAPSESSHQGAK